MSGFGYKRLRPRPKFWPRRSVAEEEVHMEEDEPTEELSLSFSSSSESLSSRSLDSTTSSSSSLSTNPFIATLKKYGGSGMRKKQREFHLTYISGFT
jgi:hypothetical protein